MTTRLGGWLSRVAALVWPRFSEVLRRPPRSLARRILLLQFAWAVTVYLMVSLALWWGTAHIIEQSLHRQAAGWLAKADELGTPLYATNDRSNLAANLDFLKNIPEILSVHYYDASGNKLVYEYWRDGAPRVDVHGLTPEVLVYLRTASSATKPIFYEREPSTAATFRISAPIWIKSLRSDGLLDFSMADSSPESVKTIGYITMRLDYGRFNAEFVNNALQASVIIAFLLLLFMGLGQLTIRWALRPLTNLEAPLVRLANGETDVEVESSGDREIAQIGRALNTTINALRERDEILRRLALQDPLTGLANRAYFDEALEGELITIERQGGSSALLFIDLDRFKHINDTYGHATGDRLLVQVAELLRKRMRDCDLIARFGGDEFTILVRGVAKHDATEIAASLIRLMQGFQFHEANESLRIYFSIGVAMIDDPALTAHDVLLRADAAASEAKRRGRNRFELYEKEVAASATEEQGWRKRLETCLDEDGLILHYQPVIDLKSGATVSYEVLVRLPDNAGGEIWPSAFLADAERYGIVAEIDRQVLRKAVREMVRPEHGAIGFSINVSRQSLEDDGFAAFVARLLAESGVAPERLLFEVAEQELSRYFDRVSGQLDALAAIGVTVVIDDFGAGFSSLGYLKRCPAACVKIDGRVIAEMANDRIDQIAIRAIADTAATRGIKTVAKFVPNEETLQLLSKLGIDCAQGNFIAPPRAAVAESETVIREGTGGGRE